MNNLKEDYLKKYTIEELTAVLINIKLGEPHLSHWLTHHEYQRLLKAGSLTKHQKAALKSDIEEKSGNALRILNLFLTSLLGIWLGYSNFFSTWQKSSTELIVITILCIIGGIFIGNLAYKSTAKEIKSSFIKIKLINLQFIILKRLIQLRQKSLQKLSDFIDQLLINDSNSSQEIKILSPSISSKYSDIEDVLLQKLESLNKILLKKEEPQFRSVCSSISNFIVIFSKEYQEKLIKLEGKGEMDILTNPNLNALKPKPRKTLWHWLVGNRIKICLDLIPMTLGTAASLFVFTSDVPSAIQKLGIWRTYSFLNAGHAKTVCLSLLILITLYFTISEAKYLYSFFKRNDEFEVISQKASTAEERLNRLDRLYHLYIQLKEKL